MTTNPPHSLAEEVIFHPERWLRQPRDWLGREAVSFGPPGTSPLQVLLAGASYRGRMTGRLPPNNEVFGPLGESAFWMFLFGMRGTPPAHPFWFRRLTEEFGAIDLPDILELLREAIAAWSRSKVEAEQESDMDEARNPERWERMQRSVAAHWEAVSEVQDGWGAVARRPGAWIDPPSGHALQIWLHGMQHGGDWLGLRPMPRLEDITKAIETRSQLEYGSPMAAYDHQSARTLLDWGGLQTGPDANT